MISAFLIDYPNIIYLLDFHRKLFYFKALEDLCKYILVDALSGAYIFISAYVQYFRFMFDMTAVLCLIDFYHQPLMFRTASAGLKLCTRKQADVCGMPDESSSQKCRESVD